MKHVLIAILLFAISSPVFAFRCGDNSNNPNCPQAKAKTVDNSTHKANADAKATGGDAKATGGDASVGDITIRNGGNGDRGDRVPDVTLGAYSSSFSSAYCMGTAQFGVGAQGIGVGGGKPVADPNCQRVIRSQAFMSMVTSAPETMRDKLLHMAISELCKADPDTDAECGAIGVLGR